MLDFKKDLGRDKMVDFKKRHFHSEKKQNEIIQIEVTLSLEQIDDNEWTSNAQFSPENVEFSPVLCEKTVTVSALVEMWECEL